MTKTFKKGFTLAEVLTTLMVIGVVAAMTIPTLMNSTDEQREKVALKKAVSVLSQATQMLQAQDDDDCVITDNDSLAACYANAIAGTPRAGGIINTPDGMSYKFFVKNEADTHYSLADACGTQFGSGMQAWRGGNACGVIVDINGSKGPSFEALKGHVLPTFNQNGFLNEPTSSDMFTLVLTSAGVRPTYFSTSSKGYEYMYGKPAQDSDVFSDGTCTCTTTGAGEGGADLVEYKNKVADPTTGELKCPDDTQTMTCVEE